MASQSTELEALLRTVAGGDRQAFRVLYEAFAPKLYGIILRICRDPGLSQDVLQETFVKVWTKAGTYSSDAGRPATWLASIARNAAIDASRRRREVPLGMDDEGNAIIEILQPSTVDADPFEFEALRNCLQHLEATQRDCVMLAYCEGYSRDELAARFGRPVGTIKTWLHRGLASLKACLER